MEGLGGGREWRDRVEGKRGELQMEGRTHPCLCRRPPRRSFDEAEKSSDIKERSANLNGHFTYSLWVGWWGCRRALPCADIGAECSFPTMQDDKQSKINWV